MNVSLGDRRIKPKGRITVGSALDLVQAVERPRRTGPMIRVGAPRTGIVSAVDYVGVPDRPGALNAQRLRYSLVDADGELAISDDGLVCSYGIFGAPGSGKTYLMLNLLRQLLQHERDNSSCKYGALILDPKSALVEDITWLVHEAGRDDDLVVLNTDVLMANREAVNVIDCALRPRELAQTLVLVAQSAGIGASDPFWFQAWADLFGAAAYLLNWLENDVLTLRRLLDALLLMETDPFGTGPGQRAIQRLAREGKKALHTLDAADRQDAERAINQIESFYRQDYVGTVEAFISAAYGSFQESYASCYSPVGQSRLAKRTNFYDSIIEEGKIVLVSVSPADPGLAKTLCTLVKCLFQRTVLGRDSRVRATLMRERAGSLDGWAGALRNFERPVLLACDEYAEIASEVSGQPMGDGQFFSQARQQGCMGLLATQSVNVLQATSLKEAWRSVFSNFAAKFFMRLVDNETAEEATKLAGESDWYVTSQGASLSKDGQGSSSQRDLHERKSLPTEILTQVLRRGEAVVIGVLDGGKGPDGRGARDSTMFLRGSKMPERTGAEVSRV